MNFDNGLYAGIGQYNYFLKDEIHTISGDTSEASESFYVPIPDLAIGYKTDNWLAYCVTGIAFPPNELHYSNGWVGYKQAFNAGAGMEIFNDSTVTHGLNNSYGGTIGGAYKFGDFTAVAGLLYMWGDIRYSQLYKSSMPGMVPDQYMSMDREGDGWAGMIGFEYKIQKDLFVGMTYKTEAEIKMDVSGTDNRLPQFIPFPLIIERDTPAVLSIGGSYLWDYLSIELLYKYVFLSDAKMITMGDGNNVNNYDDEWELGILVGHPVAKNILIRGGLAFYDAGTDSSNTFDDYHESNYWKYTGIVDYEVKKDCILSMAVNHKEFESIHSNALGSDYDGRNTEIILSVIYKVF